MNSPPHVLKDALAGLRHDRLSVPGPPGEWGRQHKVGPSYETRQRCDLDSAVGAAGEVGRITKR